MRSQKVEGALRCPAIDVSFVGTQRKHQRMIGYRDDILRDASDASNEGMMAWAGNLTNRYAEDDYHTLCIPIKHQDIAQSRLHRVSNPEML